MRSLRSRSARDEPDSARSADPPEVTTKSTRKSKRNAAAEATENPPSDGSSARKRSKRNLRSTKEESPNRRTSSTAESNITSGEPNLNETFTTGSDSISQADSILNTTFTTPAKQTRKKWVKFDSITNNESPLLRKCLDESEITWRINEAKNAICKRSTEKKKPSAINMPTRSSSKRLSMLKTMSESKKSSVKANRKNSSGKSSETKGSVKRTVMPDFTKIHNKAYEQMESLQDYSDRKKERAKKLMKGEKPESDTRRQLFSVESAASNKQVPPIKVTSPPTDFPLIPSSPLKAVIAFGPREPLTQIVDSKPNEVSPISKSRRSQTAMKSATKENKIVVLKLSPINKTRRSQTAMKSATKENKAVESKLSPINNTRRSQTGLKSVKKGNKSLSPINITQRSQISSKSTKTPTLKISPISKSRRSLISKSATKSKPLSPIKFNNKSPPKVVLKPQIKSQLPVRKVQEIKKPVFSRLEAIAAVNKLPAQTKEKCKENRRQIIRGVRTNRRFELLMKMRTAE